MLIYGENIFLRAIEEDDNEMLYLLINDPDTEAMLGGSSWPVSKAEQLKWFEMQEKNRKELRCIVALKENYKAVGIVILSDIDQKNGTAQIHIKMSPVGGRGKGYGSDSVRTLVSYAFKEMRLNCIYATIISYNYVSIRMLEKCGFEKEGILRERVFKGGKFIDLLEYSILNRNAGI